MSTLLTLLTCVKGLFFSIFVAIMFVQATKSRRQNKTYVSYLVRESFRTSQGPRSRTVSNISALPPEVRDLVAAALSGKTCVALEQIELSPVRSTTVDWRCCEMLGNVSLWRSFLPMCPRLASAGFCRP